MTSSDVSLLSYVAAVPLSTVLLGPGQTVSLQVFHDTEIFIHDTYREKYRDTRYIAILVRSSMNL